MSDDDNTENDWDEKHDLTRIEDLSEFLHEDDPDVEEKLKQASDWDDSSEENNEASQMMDLNELEDSQEGEFPPLPSSDDIEDEDEENYQEANQPESDFSFNETDEDSDNQLEDSSFGESEFGNSDLDEGTSSDFGTDSFGPSDSFPSTDTLQDSDEFNSEDEGEEGDSDFNAFEAPTDPAFEVPLEFDNSEFASDELDSEQVGQEEEQQENDQEENQEEDQEEEEEYSTSSLNFSSENDQDADQQNYQNDSFNDSAKINDSYESETPSSLIPPTVAPTPSPPIVAREDFQELRDFGNAISYGTVTAGGNPPYTLILRNVKYEEDAEDIMILLREHGLVSEENETITLQGLQSGHLLISQISEYSAIYLAHKMRRFDVQIRIGLSEQLHPTKSYTHDNKGLVSKYNLRQDRRETVEMQKTMVDIDDIVMSTTSSLDGYDVLQYIKVLTAHYMISELDLQLLHERSCHKLEDTEKDESPKYAYENFHSPQDKLQKDAQNLEQDGVMQQYNLGLEDIYTELAQELRNEAFKEDANAVIGMNYSISPIMMPSLKSDKGEMHYKITCTGNAVWISDRP